MLIATRMVVHAWQREALWFGATWGLGATCSLGANEFCSLGATCSLGVI